MNFSMAVLFRVLSPSLSANVIKNQPASMAWPVNEILYVSDVVMGYSYINLCVFMQISTNITVRLYDKEPQFFSKQEHKTRGKPA